MARETHARMPGLLWLIAVALVALGGCSDGDPGTTPTPGTAAATTTTTTMTTTTATAAAPSTAAAAAAVGGTVSVFAAASLTDVFEAVGRAFADEYPGVSVQFNFAGSSALATQIEQAAPADVFASANTAQMQRLIDAGLIAGEPRIFATNEPVIIVPADNPGSVSSPADLAQPGLRLVLALEDVPIGRYAREVIGNLAADPAYPGGFGDAALANVVSSEEDVRAVLAKVELGEADAGIVYETDAAVGDDRVRAVEIPEAANVVAEYPIAVTTEAANPEGAAAFVDFLLGETAQAMLADAGFGASW